MKSIALLLCAATAFPGFGQSPAITGPSNRMFGWVTRDYRPRRVGQIDFEDSPRLEKLMRAGNIYLSLRDAIALALENNLDLEYARLNPKLAEANLLRADAGQLLRNVSTSVSQGPTSASLGILAGASVGVLAGASSLGTTGATSSGTQSGVLSGLNVQLAGSAIPNLDPVAYAAAGFAHATAPQTSTFVTGTNFLVTQYQSAQYGIQQSFLTGTTVQLGMSDTIGLRQNAPTNDFNPTTSAGLSLSITQNLLLGFPMSVNNREIRVAKNQRNISDLAFKEQVIATVANVVSLYWDLVSFNQDLKVRQQSRDLNQKLYDDNRRRAELGAIAPIDIVQAEADLKASQQDVTNQETQVLQQEMILKSALTRGGLNNLAIVNARIVPTDHIQTPEQEPVVPIQDLIQEAMVNRPEIEQSRIGLEDSRITTLGVKNALLPTLQTYLTLQNNGLAGQVNPILEPSLVGTPNSFFLGGFGSVLDQIFTRKFPNYTMGFQLTVPIRNRAAQADLITDQLNYRQQQINDKQLQNSIKLSVLNAWVAVSQARAAWDTSVQARKLQEQTLAGEQRKYELGSESFLNVVIVQRDTVTRQLAEVDALDQYVRARTNLAQMLGTILRDNNVDMGEAQRGEVGREPDLIPAAARP
jgi:outer membrane protein